MAMLALVLGLLLPMQGSDSLPELKKCGSSLAPFGIVRASGTVALVVNGQGKIEVDSLVLITVEGSSPAGFRSVLARRFPACRFRPAKVAGRAHAIRIRALVSILGDTVRWGPLARAEVGDTADAPDLPQPIPVSPGEVLAFADPRLDERPTAIKCTQHLVYRDEIVSKERVAGRSMLPEPAPPSPGAPPPVRGEVLLRYVVTPDGAVDPATIDIVQAPSPDAARAAKAAVTSCTWAPGRANDVAVSVRIAGRERF